MRGATPPAAATVGGHTASRFPPWWIHLLLALAYAAGLFGLGGPAFRMVAGSAAAFLLPGPALLALIGLRRGAPRDLIAGVALSPVLLGAVVAAAGLRDLSPAVWVHAVILLAGVALVLEGLRGGAEDEASIGLRPWGIGLVFVLLAALVQLPFEWRRLASDAWFHCAVVYEIERGGLPPGDPYFAGLSLQYFWFFHAALVAFIHAAGNAPGATMALFNMVAVGLCVPAAVRLGRALGFSRAGGIWGGLMFLLGLGGLFWLFFPLRLAQGLVGETKGAEAFREIFTIWPLSPWTTARFVDVLNDAEFILKKFLIGTPASWAFLLVIVTAGFAVLYLRRGRRRDLTAFFLSAAAATYLHLILGGASVAGLTGAAGLLFLVGGERRRALALAGAGVAAIAVCLPYVLSLTLGSESAFPLGINPRYWASLPGSLLGVALLAVPVWRRLRATPEHRFFLLWIGAATFYGIFARLPGGNQYDKAPMVFFIPLALAAGFGLPTLWACTSGRRRRWLAIFLVLFLVPQNALRWAGFCFQAPPAQYTGLDQELYRWIGEETPRDAIFVDTKERVDVLVRGPRRQYWGVESYAMQWGYPREELDTRRTVVRAIYGTEALTAGDLAPLRAADDPVYVIAREADRPGIGARLAACPDLLTEVYAGNGNRVFAVRREGGRGEP